MFAAVDCYWYTWYHSYSGKKVSTALSSIWRKTERAGKAEQSASLIFARQASFLEKLGRIEGDPRKFTVVAVTARPISVITSSHPMIDEDEEPEPCPLPKMFHKSARDSTLLLFMSDSMPLEEIRPIYLVLVPSPHTKPLLVREWELIMWMMLPHFLFIHPLFTHVHASSSILPKASHKMYIIIFNTQLPSHLTISSIPHL